MIFLGCFLLLALIIIIGYWYKRDGVLFFANYGRMGGIIWLLGLGLYDIQLTELYNPDLFINIISLIVVANFIVISIFVPSDIDNIYDCCHSLTLNKSKAYMLPVFATIAVGVFSFVYNLQEGKLRFFIENKGTSQDISFSYFLFFMVPVSLLFYIYFRNEKNERKKIIYLVLSLLTLFMIFTNMSRGPIQYWLLGVLIYEIGNYCYRCEKKWLSLKQIIPFVILLVIGIWMFGAIGDARISAFSVEGVNEFYRMKGNYPSGLTWLYIYISSTFENARFIIEQPVKSLTWGNQLLYPFIKAVANIFGRGSEYQNWLLNTAATYPILKDMYGLNVSGFMSDAYSDFGIIGIFIYLFFYDLIAILLHKILNNNSVDKITKIIIFSIMLNISIWSVFSDSVFRIIIIWIDALLVYLWQWFGKKIGKFLRNG